MGISGDLMSGRQGRPADCDSSSFLILRTAMMEAFEPMLCNTGTVNLNPATSSDLENCRLTLEHALHTGYLTQGQYQARLMWLSAATTVGELESLTADLPSHR